MILEDLLLCVLPVHLYFYPSTMGGQVIGYLHKAMSDIHNEEMCRLSLEQ